MDKNEQAIRKIVFPYLKSLTFSLCKTRPKDIVKYMINYLQNEAGYTASGWTVDEKQELEALRKKVKEYRERDQHTKFIIEQLSNKKLEDEEAKSSVDENESDDVMSEGEEKRTETKMAKSNIIFHNNRTSVSAEVYGKSNKKENFEPPFIQKSNEQIWRIKSRILTSFIFSNLEKKDLEIVIGAMKEMKYSVNDKVITQGEEGHCLFIVEVGDLDCFKKFSSTSEDKIVKTYTTGDSFGEWALWYNSPRAATVVAKTNCILWALDRETFNRIVKEATQKKREKYESFFKQVDILSTIENYELTQICDAIKVGTYQKGDYIIRENEFGDVFYFWEEGECVATKRIEAGKADQELKRYKKGDYFGERALIKGEPRYANIIAFSDLVKVISWDRNTFKRLWGPIEDVLKRNMTMYNIYCVEEGGKRVNEKDKVEKEEKLPSVNDVINCNVQFSGQEKTEDMLLEETKIEPHTFSPQAPEETQNEDLVDPHQFEKEQNHEASGLIPQIQEEQKVETPVISEVHENSKLETTVIPMEEENKKETTVLPQQVPIEPKIETQVVSQQVSADPTKEEQVVSQQVSADPTKEEQVVSQQVSAEPTKEEQGVSPQVSAEPTKEEQGVSPQVSAEPTKEEQVVSQQPEEPKIETEEVSQQVSAEPVKKEQVTNKPETEVQAVSQNDPETEVQAISQHDPETEVQAVSQHDPETPKQEASNTESQIPSEQKTEITVLPQVPEIPKLETLTVPSQVSEIAKAENPTIPQVIPIPSPFPPQQKTIPEVPSEPKTDSETPNYPNPSEIQTWQEIWSVEPPEIPIPQVQVPPA